MAKPATIKSCRTCRSCRSVEDFDRAQAKMIVSKVTGLCHRFPPQMVAPNQSAFPFVKLDEWSCDEWRKA